MDSQQEQQHQSLLARIQHLPPSVGVVLMGIGAVGLLIPGPIGTPFILAGGLVLAPRVFGSVDRMVQRRCPDFYATSMQAVERFMSDMEKRYPSQINSNSPDGSQSFDSPTPEQRS